MTDARVTRLDLEAATVEESEARVTRVDIEAATRAIASARMTRLQIEVAFLVPPLASSGSGWGIPIGI